MEVGESSAAKMSSSDGEVWTKLAYPVEEVIEQIIPSDSRYSDIEIMSNEVVICSEISSSSTKKHKWCKIMRNSNLCSATIKNISSNPILVDEAPVQNEDDIVIKSGSDIVPDPDREGVLSYRFKLMPSPESQKEQIKVCIDFEHAKCSICLNIWHDVVTVAPCLHNFCNGCFSEWLRRSQEKHASVLCPHCRSLVQFVGRNHFLHNIEKDILQADPSLKRSDEEVALLDSYASIRSNLVIGTGKNHRKKRARTHVDVESDSLGPCPQCDTAFGGFRCNQRTIHLQCHACNDMMPSRTDITAPQHCMGCDRAFCGAYWHSQRGIIGDLHAMCSHETFQPISQHTISQIPFLAHESNRHEQDVTMRCISQMGRTLQDVVSEWIAKLNNREIDRTRMPLNHAEMITAATHVCNECYEKLVSFLLYWFRISIPKYHLPSDISNREDCWYGYACRTQHRSEEHARKRNHVCRPTRGGV